MCGIAGCLALAVGAGPDQTWVGDALDRISHRGPDDEGTYTDQDVCLGFRRLAILDLSQAGHQPMKSADGRYWMVFNGEIYNYLELGQELRDQGVQLRSSGDAEVLLETYALVGKDVVHRLRGMYAFAIWDTWTRELFCARDPFGIKPFYYRIERGPGAPSNGRAAAAAANGGPGQPGPGQPGSGEPGAGYGDPGHGDPGQGSRGQGSQGWDTSPAAQPGHGAAPWDSPAWDSPAAPQPGRNIPPWDDPGAAPQPGRNAPPWEIGTDGPGGAPGGPPWDSMLSAPLPEDAPRPRGGRHAAPAQPGADAGAGHPGDSPADHWFAPPADAPGRRPGRHAAGNGSEGGAPYAGQREPGQQSPGQQSAGQHGNGYAGPPPGPGTAPGAARPVPAAARPAPQPQRAPAGQGAGTGAQLMLRFASERKALAGPGELHNLDEPSLRRYLAFQYVPPPETITPPIRVLPPGHAMIARPGSEPDVYRYWRADLRPAKAASENSAHAILAAMRDSVAVHLRSHAPLGAFLSGGIDSAAICALVAEHRPDLLTFTVGFEREGYSEIDRAQETAAAIGVRSIPYVISQEEFFYHLPQIIWHMDDPMADAAAVPLWFVAREAAKHVKVVLSGEGSDELFGGYAIYHQPGVVRAGEKMPDWGRAPIRKAASIIPSGVKGRGFLERTSTPLRRRYIGNARVFTDAEIGKVTRPGPGVPWDVTDPVYDQAEQAGLDDVSTMQLIDINTWLSGDILVKADRMTMAHSLELRVPFLDREVMAVASRLARTEKIGAGTTKLALREAMSEVLPKAAAERAKLGFPVPIGHWIKGEASGFAEQLFRDAQTDQWINRAEAMRLLEGYQDGEPGIEWRHVWVLIVFSLWHRIFVEQAYDPVALGWERSAPVGR